MKHDPYKWFRDLSRDEQREHILDVCRMCVDGAQVSLARKIEIYLESDECPYDCGYCHVEE